MAEFPTELIITMPNNMTKERINILRAYGAEVVLTPAAERMPGAIRKALELRDEIPGSFVPQQFENAANPDIHRRTTALEILEQMEGRLDAFVNGRPCRKRGVSDRASGCSASRPIPANGI
jgi:cysteine synthase A